MTKTPKAPPAPPRPRVGLVTGARVGTALSLAAAATLIVAPLTRAEPGAPGDRQERGGPPESRGTRSATFNGQSYDATARTVEAVFSSGSRVRRWFGYEELAMEASAIDLTRVTRNLCPFLDTHNQYENAASLGTISAARVENGQLVGTIKFADTDRGRLAEGQVSRGELTGISIGYLVRTWQLAELLENDDEVWRAMSWELLEVSLVSVPADPNAGVRSLSGTQPGTPVITAAPGEIQEEDDMLKRNLGGGTAPIAGTTAAPTTTRSEPAAPDTVDTPVQGEQQRQAPTTVNVAAIRSAVTNAGLGDDVAFDLIGRHETQALTRDALMADIGRRFAERDTPATTVNRISVTRDAGDTMRRGMEDFILHRMSPGSELTELGRGYRGMSLLRMAEEHLGAGGVNVRGMTPNEIAERALHTTSDFANILGNGLNRRLRAAYEENQPSYRSWARRAPNAPDFRSIDVLQISAMPDLVKTSEAGEFRYGTATDGKVSYAVITYGRIIGVSRQLIVNDDLRALERMTTGFAGSASRLENRTVYAQITSNPVMPDGKTLFHADHGNLGSGPISATSLGSMRTGMRLQKGLQGEELNLMPAHLLAPATQEQLAYQYTSSQFVPAKATDVNEFRAGGRTAIDPVVEAVLDANSTTAWYGAAANSSVDTVEYCYLEGSEGVQMSSRVGFTVDGVELKASLDFAAAVIDHRGLWKSTGA